MREQQEQSQSGEFVHVLALANGRVVHTTEKFSEDTFRESSRVEVSRNPHSRLAINAAVGLTVIAFLVGLAVKIEGSFGVGDQVKIDSQPIVQDIGDLPNTGVLQLLPMPTPLPTPEPQCLNPLPTSCSN